MTEDEDDKDTTVTMGTVSIFMDTVLLSAWIASLRIGIFVCWVSSIIRIIDVYQTGSSIFFGLESGVCEYIQLNLKLDTEYFTMEL